MERTFMADNKETQNQDKPSTPQPRPDKNPEDNKRDKRFTSPGTEKRG